METYGWYDEFHKKSAETLEHKVAMRELDITEQIIAIMEALDISRAELAKRLNISKAAVSKFLNNGSNITLQRAVAITEALGCDLDFSFRKKSAASTTKTVTLSEVSSFKISGCYLNKVSVSCPDDYDPRGGADVGNAA